MGVLNVKVGRKGGKKAVRLKEPERERLKMEGRKEECCQRR